MKPEDIVSVNHIITLRNGTILTLEGSTKDGFDLLEKATMCDNLDQFLTPEPSPGFENCNAFDFDSTIEKVSGIENELSTCEEHVNFPTQIF